MAQDDKTRANALIDEYSDAGGLNVEALCDKLSQIVMTWTLTVFEIFEILTARQFTQSSHEQMALGLVNRINPTNLIQLEQSEHGKILLSRIWFIMNCQNNGSQRVCQYIAVADARAKEFQRQLNETGEPQKLSDEQIDYYKRKAKAKGEKFNEEIVWDFPISGPGFVVYSHNDMKKTNKNRKQYDDEFGYDQIGTKGTLDRMIALAQQWTSVSDQKLQIGDISRPGGIDTPDHLGHQNGKIVDIRPLRNAAYANEDFPCYYTDKARYNRPLTIEFIRLIRKSNLIALIHFNDAEISNDSEFRGYVLKDGRGGTVHDNHLHLEFR